MNKEPELFDHVAVNLDFQRVTPELVEQYQVIAPATLGHLHNIRFMDPGIRPVQDDVRLIGPAFTVRTHGMDSSATRLIEQNARPGDVIVVDRGGDHRHATIGEFRVLKLRSLGLAGWIVDGAATDVVELRKIGWPVYSRTISALVAKPIGVEGSVGFPVQCGGVIVNPGDLILADANGVAVLSEAEARKHLAHGLEVAEREIRMRKEYGVDY